MSWRVQLGNRLGERREVVKQDVDWNPSGPTDSLAALGPEVPLPCPGPTGGVRLARWSYIFQPSLVTTS